MLLPVRWFRLEPPLPVVADDCALDALQLIVRLLERYLELAYTILTPCNLIALNREVQVFTAAGVLNLDIYGIIWALLHGQCTTL